MASYYYLIASLPMLRAGDPPSMEYSEFLDSCQRSVSEKTYRALSELSVHSDQGPFLTKWAAFYKTLEAELCYQRNVKLNKPCTAPECRDAEVIQAVASAVNAPDPLTGERILSELEFRHLDELCSMHNFDDTVLFAYAMKLKLLQRQQLFRKEDGLASFNSLLAKINEQIFRI